MRPKVGRIWSVALRFNFGICFLRYQLTVFGGGHAFEFAEEAAEVEGILVAYNGGDFCHGVIGGFQQTGSVVHPDGQ